MKYEVYDLMKLAGVSGFTIDAREYAIGDLVRIARAAEKGVAIRIENAAGIAIDDLLRIASAGSGLISFDLVKR